MSVADRSPLELWLQSGKPLTIAGQQVMLRADRHFRIKPFELQRGQASSFILDSANFTVWYLKKFKPGRQPDRRYVQELNGQIPPVPQFRSGWDRHVLTPGDIASATSPSWLKGLAAWFDGTVLMPRVSGTAWGDLLSEIADGERELAAEARSAIAASLAAAILHLELAEVSHRDLSTGNILVDVAAGTAHLIDWDSLCHPALPFQANTTTGSPGYTAPWVTNEASRSWVEHADRFALGICIAEILTVADGMRLKGDNSLFAQDELGTATATFQDTFASLERSDRGLARLFGQVWSAAGFDECPTPADWLLALSTAVVIDARLVELAQDAAHLRQALRDGRPDRVVELLRREPPLRNLLDSRARADVADSESRLSSLAYLRETLASEDDERIAALAAAPGLPMERLRAGERRPFDLAVARVEALRELRASIERGDDTAIAAHWWRSMERGCQIPPDLTALARAARARLLIPASSPPAPSSPTSTTPAPPSSWTSPTAALRAAQSRAVGAVGDALAREHDEALAAATGELIEAGGDSAGLPWEEMLDVRHRVAAIDGLGQALAAGDSARASRLWSEVRTRWPGALDQSLDAQGRAAFRHWGRALRTGEIRQWKEQG